MRNVNASLQERMTRFSVAFHAIKNFATEAMVM
jgi:hypothetical protein